MLQVPPPLPRDGLADAAHDADDDSARLLSPAEPAREPEPAHAKPVAHAGTAAAMPATATANKILFLDGLRGLAAMLVIVQHAGYMGSLGPGQQAVDTFFVLSAFLLTMIFERKARTLLQQNASYTRWGWALLDYFVRRFLRVYPLFAIVAFVVWALPQELKERYFVSHNADFNLLKVLLFEFKFRYHVFWTLPLEITYYFIIPVFVVVLLKLQRFWLVPMLPLTYFVMYSGFYWFRLDHMPLKPHLPTFLCGSMAAFVYAKIDQWITARQFVFRWYHTLLLRSVEYVNLALLFSVFFDGLFFDWVAHDPIPKAPGGRFVSATVSVVIVCEMLQRGPVSSVLEWSLLRFAGKVSFSMYMLHSFVVYSDWVKHQRTYYNRFFAIWWLTFLLSTVSYHLIEYPCQWAAGKVGAAIKKKDAIERIRTAQALPTTSHDPSHNHTV